MVAAALLGIGVLIGILASMTGLGGGFLVVPLLMFLDKNEKVAVGTSFLFVFLVAMSSLFAHLRLGNMDYKTGLLLAAGGMLGAQAGPIILSWVPAVLFKRAFAVLIVGLGVWLFASAKA